MGYTDLAPLTRQVVFLKQQYGQELQGKFLEILGLLYICNNDYPSYALIRSQLEEIAAVERQSQAAQLAGREQTIHALMAQVVEKEQAMQALSTQVAEREQAMQALSTQVAEREQAVQALTAQVAEREQAVQALSTQVAEREQSVQALTAQVANKEQQVQALTAQVAEREQSVQALSTQVAEREQAVQALSTQVAEKEQSVQARMAQVAEREQSVQALTAQMAERQQAVEALTAQVAEKEQQVQALTAQVAEKEKEQQVQTLTAPELKMEQSVEALSAQVAKKNQTVQALREQVNEITISKAWRVALFLRRIRVRLAPPSSLRARLLRIIFSPILFLLEGIILKQRQQEQVALIRSSELYDEKWYLKANPYIAQAGVDPVMHYLLFGGFEGRDPGPNFWTAWYLDTYGDVKKAGINPLVHYLKYGRKEGRANQPGQNDQAQVPQISSVSNNKNYLIKAYIFLRDYGIRELLKKVKNRISNVNPIEKQDFRNQPITGEIYFQAYSKMLTTSAENTPEYIPFEENDISEFNKKIKVIAYYLPQFHPIPENDKWWGKGFTEWTNVTKAVPQFIGHYQPHLPGELGFYDLRLPEVQERQVDLARNYGIYGFCFYYYWFNGKRLLERPLDQFIENPRIDFPFCICWANENWTRRWDGLENDVLLAQTHTHKSDIQFIKDLEPVLRHPNYINIGGRPLIIVYRTSLMENPAKAAATWRKYCIKEGVGNPYLVAAQTFGFTDPRPIGFDAAVEFPPHNIAYPEITNRMKILNPNFLGRIYNYADMAYYSMKKGDERPYIEFKTIAPSWDNAPRKPGNGYSFAFSTPIVYGRWLEWASQHTIQKNDPEERLVFVNAWNEWSEGTHLEPDRRFGYAYLQATANAIRNISHYEYYTLNGRIGFNEQITKKHDTAVVIHIYYPDLWEEIDHYLQNLDNDFDLYISMPEGLMEFKDTVFQEYPNAHILFHKNIGRDVAPFLQIFQTIYPLNYKYLLKLHTKKSPHREDGELWRQDLFKKLLSSSENIQMVKSTFDSQENVGIIAPRGHVLDFIHYKGLVENKELLDVFTGKLGIPFDENSNFNFIAGTMFWAKPTALQYVNLVPISDADFEPEPIKKDGTIVHAFERFVGLSVSHSGFTILEIDEKGGLFTPSPLDDHPFPFAQPTQ